MICNIFDKLFIKYSGQIGIITDIITTEGAVIMERLDKILSSQGICTRKEAKKLCASGGVIVNGCTVKKSDTKIDPEKSEIVINGVRLEYKKYIYIMMNKPSGVLSASNDKHAETVIDLVPDEYKREGLFPAGRLDKDTTGLMIITDDGDIAHRMLSPKNHVYKLYRAELDAPFTDKMKETLESGITLDDGTVYKPARIKSVSSGKTTVEIEICEGKFHQVKKMFAYSGANVTKLKRLAVGGLFLDESLKEGDCRLLTDFELGLIFDSNNN